MSWCVGGWWCRAWGLGQTACAEGEGRTRQEVPSVPGGVGRDEALGETELTGGFLIFGA